MTFDCKQCPNTEDGANKALDHMILYHGFTVEPSPVYPPESEAFTVSPYGLADQFGLPTYEGE